MRRESARCSKCSNAQVITLMYWCEMSVNKMRMTILRTIIFSLSFLFFTSCEEVKEYPWNDAWNEIEQETPGDTENSGDSETPGDSEIPETPSEDTPADPEEPTDSETPVEPEDPQDPPLVQVGKARMVWIDAAANFKDYANSESKIDSDMQRLKETGFTGVVVDVRPTNTGVLFKSSVESALTRVDAWVTGGYKWVNRTESFDYLQAFIDAGKKHGLDVYASINTMVGGCYLPYGLGPVGLLYDDSSKRSWASVVNTDEGLVNTLDINSGTKFLNPANDEVVEYLVNLLAELAEYDLTGIILDRCRYDDNDLLSDFSEVSREKFEEYIGGPVTTWPINFTKNSWGGLTNVTTLHAQWLAFRAKNIHDFIEKASAKVHSVNPDIRFGAYVGGWYSTYFNSGVNWASPNYNAKNSYSWATEDYSRFGYADHCDIMIIGAYASTESVYGSGEWTMQGFCKRAETLFAGDVPFVGGPDIGNSTGFPGGKQGALMPSIVDACINASTEGMFFFDLCHIKMYDYWDDIKTAFDQYLEKL